MLFWALNDNNANIIYVSPTYMMAREVFSKLLQAMDGLDEETGKRPGNELIKIRNKTNLSLTFVNGSKISCFSGERYDNLRGLTVTHVVLDEFAYSKPELWEKVIKPATFVKGKKIIFISTPFSKNHFYTLFMMGENGKKGYRSFTAPSTENPYIDPDEINEMEKNDLIFQQEYMAKFLDTSLTVFPNLKEQTYPEPMELNERNSEMKYFIGIDLGRYKDATCAICLDNNRRVVDMLTIRFKEWSDQIDAIEKFYHKWKPANAKIEINFNDNIYEILKARGCTNLKPFHTSAQSKPLIVEDLSKGFQDKKITIPDIKYLYNELDSFTYRFNPNTHRISYSAPNGLHDDSVIALCLANNAWKDRNPLKKALNYSII